MPSVAELPAKVDVPNYPPDELLISEDGIPLETDWHAVEIDLLRDLAHQHFVGREDFFAGGNMFIYFNEEYARNKDFRGPDFFFVWGASPMPLRPYWAVWKEGGRFPNVIVELLSDSTATLDRTTKKDVYERFFRTPDYFCYEPATQILEGWHWENGLYRPLVPNEHGRLWSEQLQLWLGPWHGRYLNRDTIWLRFFTPEGIVTPTRDEAADAHVAAAEKRLSTAEQKAILVQQMLFSAEQKVASSEEKAISAEQKLMSAERQAEEQRRRAEVAEAELARLKAAQPEPKKD